MDKLEFSKSSAKSKGLTLEQHQKYHAVLECHCDEECCKGWACVSNDEYHINEHNRMYGKDGLLVDKD